MCHGREVGGREPGRELGSKARGTGLWAVCARAARSVREGRKAGGRGRGGAALGERTRSGGGAMSSALVLFSAVDMALSYLAPSPCPLGCGTSSGLCSTAHPLSTLSMPPAQALWPLPPLWLPTGLYCQKIRSPETTRNLPEVTQQIGKETQVSQS